MPAPNLITCDNCLERREAHAKSLCKTCYDKLYPGARRWGFCASPKCPHSMEYIELRARGLCPTCYDRERKAGNIEQFPKVPPLQAPMMPL